MRAGDLDPYSGVVAVNLDDYSSKYKYIGLREAATLFSKNTLGNDQGIVSSICNCNGKCMNDKRCSCFKANKLCTSHCHLKSIEKNCINCEKVKSKTKITIKKLNK